MDLKLRDISWANGSLWGQKHLYFTTLDYRRFARCTMLRNSCQQNHTYRIVIPENFVRRAKCTRLLLLSSWMQRRCKSAEGKQICLSTETEKGGRGPRKETYFSLKVNLGLLKSQSTVMGGVLGLYEDLPGCGFSFSGMAIYSPSSGTLRDLKETGSIWVPGHIQKSTFLSLKKQVFFLPTLPPVFSSSPILNLVQKYTWFIAFMTCFPLMEHKMTDLWTCSSVWLHFWETSVCIFSPPVGHLPTSPFGSLKLHLLSSLGTSAIPLPGLTERELWN